MAEKHKQPPTAAEKDRAVNALKDLKARIEAVHRQFRGELQAVLDALENVQGSTQEETRELVKTVDWLLTHLDMRLKCGRVGCDQPARIRYQTYSRRDQDYIKFDHSCLADRHPGTRPHQHGGTLAFPRMELMPDRDSSNSGQPE